MTLEHAQHPKHLWPGLACAFASTLLTAPVHAHINVNMGSTHESRGEGQKDAPCGTAGSQRGDKVYRYRPGATINISLAETIPHPGYFRIAFDEDGDDDFPIPSGTGGERGDCAGDPKCGPGREDYCSNDTVVLDNLDPHAASESKRMYTWSVTLPNIECDNCTLQIIQMMDDLNYHPAPFPADDIYYRCIDIELSDDAPEVDDEPVDNDGMVCARGQDPEPDQASDAGAEMDPEEGEEPGETADGDDDGGCSVSSTQPLGLLGPAALALLVLGLRRGRRRPSGALE